MVMLEWPPGIGLSAYPRKIECHWVAHGDNETTAVAAAGTAREVCGHSIKRGGSYPILFRARNTLEAFVGYEMRLLEMWWRSKSETAQVNTRSSNSSAARRYSSLVQR